MLVSESSKTRKRVLEKTNQEEEHREREREREDFIEEENFFH